MSNEEDLLVKILMRSHEDVMSGKSYSQEEAEEYLDQRLFRSISRIPGCLNEPC